MKPTTKFSILILFVGTRCGAYHDNCVNLISYSITDILGNYFGSLSSFAFTLLTLSSINRFIKASLNSSHMDFSAPLSLPCSQPSNHICATSLNLNLANCTILWEEHPKALQTLSIPSRNFVDPWPCHLQKMLEVGV